MISNSEIRNPNSKIRNWEFLRLSHSAFRIPQSEIRNREFLRLFHSAFRIPHSEIGKKGFTLIEIIILIVMAGILLPAIIVPFATGVRGSGKPEMVTTAMYLAHHKMEEFMKYQYQNAALNPTALTAYAAAPIADYQWQWQIYYVDSDFNVVGDGISATNHRGYKRILVRVRDPMNDTYEIYGVVTFFP